MTIKYYETIFEVTETLQNGRERRIKKSVYSLPFKNNRHVPEDERIAAGIEELKLNHYYNIEYCKTKNTYLMFS